MCGFVGFLDRQNLENPLNTLDRMSKVIQHRGPDDSDIWQDERLKFYVSFRRLAILDLTEAGRQPMLSKSGRYVICFNGEIYNHLEIRESLLKDFDYSNWIGSSDSETLLAAIEHYGLVDALNMSVGMFALSLFDKKTQELSLARDRFGEKPLYYGWTGKSFVFGSEIGSIKKFDNFSNNLSDQAVSYFLNYSYVPSNLSIYEGILKVDAAEIIIIDLRNNCIKEKKKFWDLEREFLNSKTSKFSSYQEGIEILEEGLRESLRIQMIADVPLGAFLSGGIDSSLITALMQDMSMDKVKTFTIGFENKNYDESKHAGRVAKHLGTEHTKIDVTENEALEVIPLLPNYYSEPFADSSQIPTFLVSKIAKEKVTVALSGDGGDELFGGYTRYLWGEKIWNKISVIPFPIRKLIGKGIQLTPESIFLGIEGLLSKSGKADGVSFLNDKAKKLSRRLTYIHSDRQLYNSLATQWNSLDSLLASNSESSAFIDQSYFKELSFIENMMLWDISSYLKEDILTKVDRAAMSNSLETRAPFLDHRLAKIAFRFDESMLINNRTGKMPLRSILDKYVPKNITERPKAGFGIPVGIWMRDQLRDWAESYLNENLIKAQGILNYGYVQKIWSQHLKGNQDHTVRLWNILMLSSWLEDN